VVRKKKTKGGPGENGPGKDGQKKQRPPQREKFSKESAPEPSKWKEGKKRTKKGSQTSVKEETQKEELRTLNTKKRKKGRKLNLRKKIGGLFCLLSRSQKGFPGAPRWEGTVSKQVGRKKGGGGTSRAEVYFRRNLAREDRPGKGRVLRA